MCGILGFGNVGVATARLMRAFGMQIHAINRRGASAEPTDWIATTARLDEMLRAADVFVVCAALTTETAGLIGARELALMQEDAISSTSRAARSSMRRRYTPTSRRTRGSSPASTHGGSSPCAMAGSRWATHFSICRT